MFRGVNDSLYLSAAVLKHSLPDRMLGDALVSMCQTHSNSVVFVHGGQGGLSSSSVVLDRGKIKHQRIDSCVDFNHPNARAFDSLSASFVVNSDALITDDVGLVLSVKAADCLPVFIMGGGYISVIHAGREGTLKHISRHVSALFKALGVQEIDVWFGPCACVCCYEIHSETATHFDMVLENADQIGSIYHDDAHFINREGHDYCTQCRHDILHSYRMGDTVDRNIFYLKKYH